MQDHRSHGRACERSISTLRKEATTDERDTAVEAAVIVPILSRHPAQLTLAELVRELAGDPAEFAQVDGVERAVRDLAGVGLLNRSGEFVIPSQAALRLDRLTDAWSRVR